MTTRINLVKHLNQENFRHARDEYLQAWRDFMDDKKGEGIIARHAAWLERETKTLEGRHTKLIASLKQGELGPATEMVTKKAASNLNRRISRLKEAGKSLYRWDLEWLRQEGGEVIKVLESLDLDSSYVEEFYGKSRPETWDRYAPLDAVYELGQKFAIEQPDRDSRAHELAKIPHNIRLAKWRFMLTLADAAYGIDIGHLGGDSIDPSHLSLLSELLARLSDNERGADSDIMPQTHKYRHNPAIHSLHVVALADKIFQQVAEEISKGALKRISGKDAALAKLKTMRAKIFLAALVHDMGEIDGELSQAAEREATREQFEKEGRAEQFEQFEKDLEEARGRFEHDTFTRYLDSSMEKIGHVPAERATMRSLYCEAFDLPEKTDTFLGRFFKTLERTQSQQDYLRFQGLSGAPPLINATPDKKKVGLTYVPKVFYDGDAFTPGPHSLDKLAQYKGDKTDRLLQGMLANDLEQELNQLVLQNIQSYYGSDSPEMRAFRSKAKSATAR